MKKIVSLIIALTLLVCTVPIIVSAAEAPLTFSLNAVEGKVGDTVQVDLSIANNPGITTFRVYVNYPEEALKLTNVDCKTLFSSQATHSAEMKTPFTISWFSAASKDETQNGIIATLYFEVLNDATSDSYTIDLQSSKDEVCNTKLESFDDLTIIDGTVSVKRPHTHSLTKVAAKAATCTEGGNKEYFVCDGCSKWFEDEAAATEITDHDSVVIKAKGHAPSDWIVDKEATESEKGSKHKECTVCGEILEKAEIPVIKPTEPPTDKPTDDPTKPTDDPTKPTDKPTQPGTKTTTGTSSVQSTPKSNGKSGVVNTGDGSLVFLFAVVMIGGCVSAYLINNYRKKKTSK